MMLGKAFKVQIQRALGPRLILIAALAAFLQLLSAAAFFRHGEGASVWYIVYNSMMTGINFLTIYLLPVLIFADTLVREKENNAAQFWIVRQGVAGYTLSKIAASAIGGCCCVFLEFVICFFVIRITGRPWFSVNTMRGILYADEIESGRVFSGFFMFLLDMGFSGAVIAVFGLTASIWLMNPFTAAAAPLALTMILSRTAEALKLPDEFDPQMWLRPMGTAAGVDSAFGAMLYKAGISLIVIAVLAVLGICGMKRRLKDG